VIYRLRQAAYLLACLAIAVTATWAASLPPITDPATGQGVCIVAGSLGLLLAQAWLPCPCHRKDHR
jgi:hypothetical protein